MVGQQAELSLQVPGRIVGLADPGIAIGDGEQVMEFKPPARASVLLLEVFRKRALLNTWPWPLSPALPKCSTTLFNNGNRSTTASRVC